MANLNITVGARNNNACDYVDNGNGGDNNDGGDDHGDGRGDATTIGVDGRQSGRIDSAGDVDWFRISATESGTLTAYTTGSLGTVGRLCAWEKGGKVNRVTGCGGMWERSQRHAELVVVSYTRSSDCP